MTKQEWNDRMEQLLVTTLDSTKQVNAVGLRAASKEQGLDLPQHHNQWGPLMQRMVRKHNLVFSGQYVPAPKDQAHGRPVRIWVKRFDSTASTPPTMSTQ